MIKFSNEHETGFLPEFFSEHDPRSAREQLDENYAHGGGVRPQDGFTLKGIAEGNHPLATKLAWPGDPDMKARAHAWMRDELLVLYEHDFLAIIQKDGSFIVTRCD